VPRLDAGAANWIYRYDERPGTWTKMLSEEAEDDDAVSSSNRGLQPRTRYAHQVVYDTQRKIVYLHGGNAGKLLESGTLDENTNSEATLDEQRLDDLWSMTLERYGTRFSSLLDV